MSYDLLVFDPAIVPLTRDALLRWYEAATQADRNAESTTAPLDAWYSEMVSDFPPMNTLQVGEETRLTDYSRGPDFIYAGFAWSVAKEAFTATRARAEAQRLGLYNVSSPIGEVYLPNRHGRLRPCHAEQREGSAYHFAIWKRSRATKTAMLEACYEAIQRNESHEAMTAFPADELADWIHEEFACPGATNSEIVKVKRFVSADAAWILLTCDSVLAGEVSSAVMPAALERGVMLFDPQRGAVWGNRRPDAPRKIKHT